MTTFSSVSHDIHWVKIGKVIIIINCPRLSITKGQRICLQWQHRLLLNSEHVNPAPLKYT